MRIITTKRIINSSIASNFTAQSQRFRAPDRKAQVNATNPTAQTTASNIQGGPPTNQLIGAIAVIAKSIVAPSEASTAVVIFRMKLQKPDESWTVFVDASGTSAEPSTSTVTLWVSMSRRA